MFTNNNTNNSASAIALKNASRTAKTNTILAREAYYFGDGRLSIGGISQNTISDQGSAFLTPLEIANILVQNTPVGEQPPPLPPVPQAPFPSKAFFSPNAAKPVESYNFEYEALSPTYSVPNGLYSLIFSYSYPIYTQTFRTSVFDSTNALVDSNKYMASTDYANIYINISNIPSSNPYVIELYCANYYGSSKMRFPTLINNGPMPYFLNTESSETFMFNFSNITPTYSAPDGTYSLVFLNSYPIDTQTLLTMELPSNRLL